MANHASAVKRNRQRIVRTTRNRAVKSSLRTSLKKAHAAVSTQNEQAKDLVRDAQSDLDVAAKKGVIPKKRASRLKGRLAAAQAKATKK
jgi:small subunit ribosomal protein S20